MAYESCPECGERVYNLGCVNCNEIAYIEEQDRLTDLNYPHESRYERPPAADAVARAATSEHEPSTRDKESI